MATHMAVIGSRESGKTLSLEFLQRCVLRETRLAILYANRRSHNKGFAIMYNLLNVKTHGGSLFELFDGTTANRLRSQRLQPERPTLTPMW